MHSTTILFVLASLMSAEGKSLQLADLPAAVQKTVQENLKGGQIKSIAKEKEDGIEQYEVETLVNGKARDFNVSAKGALLVIEEATVIDLIPAAAKDSIMKKVADGKLTGVETSTKTGRPMIYEASYTDKRGKKHEVQVKADGSATKE